LSEALQSSQKTVSGVERGDETSYVDDYADVGEEKQVDGYGCNNWVNEEGPSEKAYPDLR
jgi:hypothetical protein